MSKYTDIIDVRPDKALAKMLGGKLLISRSVTEQAALRVFSHAMQPVTFKEENYVTISFNGGINAKTTGFGYFDGYLVLLYYCKMHPDGTAREETIRYVLKQVQHYSHRQVAPEGYFYELDTANAITPSTINLTSGYSVTMLNIKWHTTDKFNLINNSN